MFLHWFNEKFLSRDRVERHFAYLISIIISMTVLYGFIKPAADTAPFWSIGAPTCTVWCIIIVSVLLFSLYSERHEHRLRLEAARAVLFVLLLLVVLIYYDGTNQIQRYRYSIIGSELLWDEELLSIDEFLLGYLFPRGQLALWLDCCSPAIISVNSFIGRCYAELLQWFYVSYYFWGNGLGIYLGYKYFYETVYKQQYKGLNPNPNNSNTANNNNNNNIAQSPLSANNSAAVAPAPSPNQANSNIPISVSVSMPPSVNSHIQLNRNRHQWRLIQMFTTAWVSGFLFNFCLNLVFPAVSPRIYIATAYQNEIHGFWLCDILRKALTTAAAGTFGAFPSGHCGLSWLCALLAHRMNYNKYRNAAFIAAILISAATQIMRYHYFIDFLASFALVGFGAWLGGFHTQLAYNQSLQLDIEENELELDSLEQPLIMKSINTIELDSLISDADESFKSSTAELRQLLMRNTNNNNNNSNSTVTNNTNGHTVNSNNSNSGSTATNTAIGTVTANNNSSVNIDEFSNSNLVHQISIKTTSNRNSNLNQIPINTVNS